MTLPIGTAEERELIEPVAKALYEDWVAEDFANEYAPWELLADKATWLSRAAVAATALQSRIAEVERLTKECDHWKAECKALCDVVSEHTRARASLTQGGE